MSDNFTITMVREECISCGVTFGLTTDYVEQRKEDHKFFKCPNGHSQHWPQKNKEEQLQAQLKNSRAACNRAQNCCDQKSEDIKHFKRCAAARKGALTRMKNKAAMTASLPTKIPIGYERKGDVLVKLDNAK